MKKTYALLLLTMFVLAPLLAAQVSQAQAQYEWRLVAVWKFETETIEQIQEDPFASCPEITPPQLPSEPPEGYTVVKIGALLPLTGDLASFGKANAESVKIAVRDVNKYFLDNNIPYWVEITIVDTATDPATARERFLSLYNQGYRFFVGPMSSGELGEIVNLVQQGYEAVVISQSSTAPSLALKDTVYRFPPPDELQGKVLAQLIQSRGVNKLIIVYRNDDWGYGLAGFVEDYFKKLGGEVVQMIPYDPKNPNPTGVIEQVNSIIQQQGTQGVGVELIAFEEAAGFLEVANNYPDLAKVPWFGSDGTALSQAVLQSPQAAEFADKVDWANTITFSVTDKARQVFCELKQKLGYTPDPYSLIAYDVVQVLARAIAEAGPNDVNAVAQAVLDVIKTYEGASGKIVLNEFGDRVATDYGIFEIVKVGGETTTAPAETTTTTTESPAPAPTTESPAETTTTTEKGGVSTGLIVGIVILIIIIIAAVVLLRK